jgi:hypothetical protein
MLGPAGVYATRCERRSVLRRIRLRVADWQRCDGIIVRALEGVLDHGWSARSARIAADLRDGAAKEVSITMSLFFARVVADRGGMNTTC